MKDIFVILDFGSQLSQLIARRLREMGFYSEIHRYDISLDHLKSMKPKGIILSGGPSSVYDLGAPLRDVTELMNLSPLLGICYGMQLIAKSLGGEVEASTHREYGDTKVFWQNEVKGLTSLLNKTNQGFEQKVWMSHGDVVKKLPPGFQLFAKSESGLIASMASDRASAKKILAVQFHPEASHTESGSEVLKYFAQEMCQAEPRYQISSVAQELMSKIKTQVGPQEEVLCALSGGVDSSVVAQLLTKTLGVKRVHCYFVDTGLLRKNEFEDVLNGYHKMGLNIEPVRAESRFLSELKGLSDPEEKRKTIGRVFIEIFDEKVKTMPNVKWLAQGTLYPDVIESVSPKGSSVTIKSHHNVGGLPANMKLKLIEPVRDLFKDEVRKLGNEIGVPEEILKRHPFPGPGLAIRIMTDVNKEKMEIVRAADHIFISELKVQNLYNQIWQAFCVLTSTQTVGVKGDGRSYEYVLSLRAVHSVDGMTADWVELPYSFLKRVSSRITNEVKGVGRVVYDISSKPPATIEWE